MGIDISGGRRTAPAGNDLDQTIAAHGGLQSGHGAAFGPDLPGTLARRSPGPVLVLDRQLRAAICVPGATGRCPDEIFHRIFPGSGWKRVALDCRPYRTAIALAGCAAAGVAIRSGWFCRGLRAGHLSRLLFPAALFSFGPA